MAVVIRSVRDQKGYGLKAFVESQVVVGDPLFEGEFRETKTLVSLAPQEYGFMSTSALTVLEPVGELRFVGIYGSWDFLYTDLTTSEKVPNQKVIRAGKR